MSTYYTCKFSAYTYCSADEYSSGDDTSDSDESDEESDYSEGQDEAIEQAIKHGKLFSSVDTHVNDKLDQFHRYMLKNNLVISANVRVTRGRASAAVLKYNRPVPKSKSPVKEKSGA